MLDAVTGLWLDNDMSNTATATEIRNNIAGIRSAAAGMNFPTWLPNEGQLAIIARLEAQLAEVEG